MIDNTALFHQLLFRNEIAIVNASFLSSTPASMPMDWEFDRAEGMLLGLAIGDALGYITEAHLPQSRFLRYGEIRDYLPNRFANNRTVGVCSDDSQMAFWTLENLITDDGLIPDHVAEEFTKHEIFGIGCTVWEFIQVYKDEGKHWTQAGQPSAGNGAVMRIAPTLIPHLRMPSAALWADAGLAGTITHNDPASNACCVAFINLLWECLRLKKIPEPIWWIDTFTSVASQLEGNTQYQSRCDGNTYQGPLWKFVDKEVRLAIAANKTSLQACEEWHSGAYLLETMPCVLYILACHGHDPEEAIIRAVNDTKDNDTVAAIVGAAVGALHGTAGLPTRWIKDLLGRTGSDDDGRIFELIGQARQVFWVGG
ncbi:MAG: ADP-ribosylglycohydrolase family protein [Anaerolineaceae bacterium]|nr:ADP-ribosylglycohydrolase family protein [Anaerolineaceae bacterium]